MTINCCSSPPSCTHLAVPSITSVGSLAPLSWCPLAHHGTSGGLLVLLVFLFLFLLLVFLLNGPRRWQLPSFLDHQVPIVLIAWMVPRGLPIGKVKIVNITCDVLAGDEQRPAVSPYSSPQLFRKKSRREMIRRQRRRSWEKGESRQKERESQEKIIRNWRVAFS